MTKSTEKETKKEEVQQPTASDKPAEQAATPQAQPQRIEVDDSNAQVCYANFCRVNGTPEELIIDFGLNSQSIGIPEKPLSVKQRLVVNYYTAKRLMGALQLSIQRHEAAFGVLETNVQNRIVPAAMRQSGTS